MSSAPQQRAQFSIASGLRRMERTADPYNFPIRFGRGECA